MKMLNILIICELNSIVRDASGIRFDNRSAKGWKAEEADVDVAKTAERALPEGADWRWTAGARPRRVPSLELPPPPAHPRIPTPPTVLDSVQNIGKLIYTPMWRVRWLRDLYQIGWGARKTPESSVQNSRQVLLAGVLLPKSGHGVADQIARHRWWLRLVSRQI